MPRWTRWLVILSGILGGLGIADALMALPPWLGVLNSIGYVLLMVLIASAQVYRYRRVSGPAERQQTKWVVFGLGLWFLLIILVTIPDEVRLSWPTDTPLPLWTLLTGFVWTTSLAIIPLCLTIALLRYRLYDIDIIIRKTLVYSLLTGLLALVYLGTVVLLQTLFGRAAAARSPLVIVLSTLLIAALFAPLRRRVQELIDRRFYRRKYDARQVLAAFAIKARDEVELDELTAELVRVVEETMRPQRVAVWLRPPGVRPLPFPAE